MTTQELKNKFEELVKIDFSLSFREFGFKCFLMGYGLGNERAINIVSQYESGKEPDWVQEVLVELRK